MRISEAEASEIDKMPLMEAKKLSDLMELWEIYQRNPHSFDNLEEAKKKKAFHLIEEYKTYRFAMQTRPERLRGGGFTDMGKTGLEKSTIRGEQELGSVKPPSFWEKIFGKREIVEKQKAEIKKQKEEITNDKLQISNEEEFRSGSFGIREREEIARKEKVLSSSGIDERRLAGIYRYKENSELADYNRLLDKEIGKLGIMPEQSSFEVTEQRPEMTEREQMKYAWFNELTEIVKDDEFVKDIRSDSPMYNWDKIFDETGYYEFKKLENELSSIKQEDIKTQEDYNLYVGKHKQYEQALANYNEKDFGKILEANKTMKHPEVQQSVFQQIKQVVDEKTPISKKEITELSKEEEQKFAYYSKKHIPDFMSKEQEFAKKHPYWSSLLQGVQMLNAGIMKGIVDRLQDTPTSKMIQTLKMSKNPKDVQSAKFLENFLGLLSPIGINKKKLEEASNTLLESYKDLGVIKPGDEKGVLGHFKSGEIGKGIELSYRQALSSAPVSFIAMASAFAGRPDIGLMAMGVPMYGIKLQELEDNPNLEDMDIGIKRTNAFYSALSEAASEELGALFNIAGVRLMIGKVGVSAVMQNISRRMSKNILTRLAKYGALWVGGGFVEGVEEFANTFANNYINNVTGVESDWDLFKGTAEALTSGTMTGLMIESPMTIGGVAAQEYKFSDKGGPEQFLKISGKQKHADKIKKLAIKNIGLIEGHLETGDIKAARDLKKRLDMGFKNLNWNIFNADEKRSLQEYYNELEERIREREKLKIENEKLKIKKEEEVKHAEEIREEIKETSDEERVKREAEERLRLRDNEKARLEAEEKEVREKLTPSPSLEKRGEQAEITEIIGKGEFEVKWLKVKDIKVDPKRFQFRTNVDKYGVDDRLKGADYNEGLAGLVTVWEQNDGKTFVVNGHHRLNLANENNKDVMLSQILKEKDYTVEEAIGYGALINIAEGNSTPIDVAKAIRNKIVPLDDIKKFVPKNSELLRQGMALSNLHDGLFQQVVTGKIVLDKAVTIGEMLGDNKEAQLSVYELMKKEKKKRQAITNDVLKDIIGIVKGSAEEIVEQTDLFGTEMIKQNLAIEKAELLSFVKNKLKGRKKILQSVNIQANKKILETLGNKLKEEINIKEMDQTEKLLFMVDKLAHFKGNKINSLLNEYSKEYGKSDDKIGIKNKVLTEISNVLEEGVEYVEQKEQRKSGEISGRGLEEPGKISGKVSEKEAKAIEKTEKGIYGEGAKEVETEKGRKGEREKANLEDLNKEIKDLEQQKLLETRTKAQKRIEEEAKLGKQEKIFEEEKGRKGEREKSKKQKAEITKKKPDYRLTEAEYVARYTKGKRVSKQLVDKLKLKFRKIQLADKGEQGSLIEELEQDIRDEVGIEFEETTSIPEVVVEEKPEKLPKVTVEKKEAVREVEIEEVIFPAIKILIEEDNSLSSIVSSITMEMMHPAIKPSYYKPISQLTKEDINSITNDITGALMSGSPTISKDAEIIDGLMSRGIIRAKEVKPKEVVKEPENETSILKSYGAMGVSAEAQMEILKIDKAISVLKLRDTAKAEKQIEREREKIKLQITNYKLQIKDKSQIPKGSKYASLDEFADIIEPKNLSKVEMPELVQLVKLFLNKYPQVRRMRTALGKFSTEGGIKLHPGIFTEEKQTTEQHAKTLSHEIMHMIDWLEDMNLLRGNILGRLLSVGYSFRKEIITQKGENPELIKVRQKILRQLYQAKRQEKAGKRHRYNVPELEKKLETINEKLVFNKEIREELWDLSKQWRPLAKNFTDNYLKYRKSAIELYADFGSALLNNPDWTLIHAPKTMRVFFDWLKAKPKVEAEYYTLMKKMNGDIEAIAEARNMNLRFAIREGYEKFVILRTLILEKYKNWKYLIQHTLWSRYTEFMRKERELFKAGKIERKDMIRDLVEEQDFLGKRVSIKLKKFQQIRDYAFANGITEEDLDVALTLYRNLTESRGKAGTLGMDIKASEIAIDHLKKKLGEDKAKALDECVDKLHEWWMEDIINPAHNLLTPEFLEKLNRQWELGSVYAPEFLQKYFLKYNMSAAIQKKMGHLEKDMPAMPIMLLKAAAIIRATEFNQFKKELYDQVLQKLDETESVRKRYTAGKSGKLIVLPYPKAPRDKELFVFKERGKERAFFINEYLYNEIYHTSGDIDKLVSNILKHPTKYARSVFVTYNPRFAMLNPIRDFRRTHLNLSFKGKNISWYQLLRLYYKNWAHAKNKALKIDDPLITEMEQAGAMFFNFSDALLGMRDRDWLKLQKSGKINETDQLLALNDLMKIHKKVPLIVKPMFWLLERIRDTTDITEALSKISAYQYLSDEVGDGKIFRDKREMAGWVRRNAGTPNFMTGGTFNQALNNILLFSNIWKEGIKSTIDVATDPRTRRGWRHKFMRYTVAPKVLVLALSMGLIPMALKNLMGWDDEEDQPAIIKHSKWLQEAYRMIPDYYKTNYISIPFYKTKDRCYFLTLPQDENERFLGGVIWKMINNPLHRKSVLDSFSSVFDFGTEQMPNVNPVIELITNWTTYFAGKIPKDWFRGNDIYEDDLEQGSWETLKPMLKWSVNKLGIRLDYRDRIEKKNLIDRAVKFSGIFQPFIRVSNAGLYEHFREVLSEDEKQKKKKRIKSQKFINEYIEKYFELKREVLREKKKSEIYYSDNEDYMSLADDIVKQSEKEGKLTDWQILEKNYFAMLEGLFEEDYKFESKEEITTYLKNRYNKAIAKAEDDPYLNQLYKAKSNKQKALILKDIYDNFDKSIYDDLVAKGRERGVITDDVAKEFAKLLREELGD